MNLKRLKRLFQSYIEHFDEISFGEHDETYKWEVTAYYRKNFRLEAEDFAGMLEKLRRKTGNLIDSGLQQPFAALVRYARQEPSTVRAMFAALYADDHGDRKAEQRRIDEFIAKSEELRKKYCPDSWRYRNDQRSVMAYLFFHDPDHHYLYRWKQARAFADFAGVTDDLERNGKLRLPVYYKMCDALTEAMAADENLMEANRARFQQGRKLDPDKNLHILCCDMIWSSQVYGLFNSLYYSRLTATEKKKLLADRETALGLQAAYEDALAREKQLEEIQAHVLKRLSPGTEVTSDTFGTGVIETLKDAYVAVRFPEPAGLRRFVLLPALAEGFIVPGDAALTAYIRKNEEIMKGAMDIPSLRKAAENELEPYRELL